MYAGFAETPAEYIGDWIKIVMKTANYMDHYLSVTVY